ncbi:MAG: hypothetical protein KDK70_33655, partial [Myxococcales bacterium]|nr:hypothetical protein [Myxococcales bacterium]
YEPHPPEGRVRWATDRFTKADFVVLVCTPGYRRYFEGADLDDDGRDVAWGAMLVSLILHEARSRNHRLIPVVFDDGAAEDIPTVLRAFAWYRVTAEYEGLYRQITRQPDKPRPPLGQLRRLPQAERPGLGGTGGANASPPPHGPEQEAEPGDAEHEGPDAEDDEQVRGAAARAILALFETVDGLSQRLARGSERWRVAAAKSNEELVDAILDVTCPVSLVGGVNAAMNALLVPKDPDAKRMSKAMIAVLDHALPVVVKERLAMEFDADGRWTINTRYIQPAESRMARFDQRPMELWDPESGEISADLPGPRAYVSIQHMPRAGVDARGNLADTVTAIEEQRDDRATGMRSEETAEQVLSRMTNDAIRATRFPVSQVMEEELEDRILYANLAMEEAQSVKDRSKKITIYTIAGAEHSHDHPFIKLLAKLERLVVLMPKMSKEEVKYDKRYLLSLRVLHDTYCTIQKGSPS